MKTKKEAAEFLGKSEKAIERLVASGQLHKTTLERSGRGGFVTYYDEAELEALVASGHAIASRRPPSRRDTTMEISSPAPEGIAELARLIGEAIAASVGNGHKNGKPHVDIRDLRFLTSQQASTFSGVGIGRIEKAIKDKRLTVRRGLGRGRRIARADLNTFLDGLDLEGAGK